MSTTEHVANPAATFEAAGELLRALAAPVRIAIVVELGTGPRCVHELVESTGAAQPLVSQHLGCCAVPESCEVTDAAARSPTR